MPTSPEPRPPEPASATARPFRRLLVALDGSASAAAVLPDAIGLAKISGAEIVLTSVLPTDPAPRRPGVPATATAEELRAYLQRQVEAVRAQHARVSSVLLRGEPAQQLIAHAIGNAVDVIVAATRARPDDGDAREGGVTATLARAAPVPLLLRRVPAPEGVRPFGRPERLLVPLDGSRLAELVLPEALRLAAQAQAKVLLLQVVDEPGALGPYAVGLGRLAERELHAAHEYLASLVAANRSSGVAMESVVRLGRPLPTISLVAADAGAEAVVLAAYGRSATGRWQPGSVANAVLRGYPGPVLLLPGGALAARGGVDRR